MNRVERDALLDRAQEIFFAGSLQGYGSGVKAQRSPERPGWKWTDYHQGDWHFHDEWYEDPETHRSFGRTTISYKDRIVWCMVYSGRYNEEAIPCLKSALQTAYEGRQFVGGRGPSVVTSGPFTYTNFWDGSFDAFRGGEQITMKVTAAGGRSDCGQHQYSGMALI